MFGYVLIKRSRLRQLERLEHQDNMAQIERNAVPVLYARIKELQGEIAEERRKCLHLSDLVGRYNAIQKALEESRKLVGDLPKEE